ncbi:MAG: hypothetical protein ACRDFX_01585 [Chloroflexota bacterium]
MRFVRSRWPWVFLLLVGLLVSTVLPAQFAGASSPSRPTTRTQVCGPITGNTTWTAAIGQYQLTCPVSVAHGATLTIQPGVTVYGGTGAGLQIQGSLVSNGTSRSKVTFTCVSSPCNPGSWNGIQFSGATTQSSVSNTSVAGASTALTDYPGATLSNDTFANNTTALRFNTAHAISIVSTVLTNFTSGISASGGFVNVLDSTFTSTTAASSAISLQQGTLRVAGSTIQTTQTGVSMQSGQVNILTSVVQGDRNSTTGIYLGPGSSLSMHLSTITKTAYALHASIAPSALSIQQSSIVNNTTGLYLDVEVAGMRINQSNLFGNDTSIDIVRGSSNFSVDATNNYWGTTSIPSISRQIIDCRTASVRTCVLFQPFLSYLPVAPITNKVLPTPGPTLAPTATGTAAPAPTIQVVPASVQAGSGNLVTVNGTGFGAAEGVTVSLTFLLQGGAQEQAQSSAATFTDGSFTAALPSIPAAAMPGTYIVTAVGETSHRSASAQLTILLAASTPTPTSTQTPTPAPTATPTSTSTPTATPSPVTAPVHRSKLAFKRAYLWYHTVRVGTWNHVVVQANHHRKFSISMHVIFPAGRDLHFAGKTNKKGHWEKRFSVARGTIGRYSHQALVILELHRGLTSKRTSLQFTLVH